MRTFRDGMVLKSGTENLRWLGLPVLVLFLMATPLSIGLYARDKDKPEKESKVRDKDKDKEKDKSEKEARRKDKDKGREKDKNTVARKEDDTARLAGSDLTAGHPLVPVLEAARTGREALQKLPGYTCTFIKQEQLKKGGLLRQVMTLKFRREPFSVYLKYVEPHAGREVIYVDGKNKGKLQAHEPSGLASIVGTLSLSPTGSEAMKENRYPVTMIGMEKMLETAISDWESALKHPDVKVDHYPEAKIGESECRMFEVVYPLPREPFKYHKARIYFEKQTHLPVRTEQYGFPAKAGDEPPLVEEYTYADLKIDCPLADADFEVNNAAYGFK